MKGTERIARESIWGTAMTYIGVAVGFLTTFFVLTRVLSPEEIGLTRLLVEIATIASTFGLMGLTNSISRYFPFFRDRSGIDERLSEHRGFFFWLMIISCLGMCVVVPLLAIAREPITAYLGQGSMLLSRYYYTLIPLCIIISFWMLAEIYAMQLLHLAAPKAIRELLLRLLLLVCYIVYGCGWIDQAEMVLLFVGSYGGCMLLSYLYLSRITKLSLRYDTAVVTPYLREDFVRYTGLALLSTAGTMLAGRMDLLALTFIDVQGLTSAGIYTIGFFMVSIIEIPTRALIGLATARIAEYMHAGDLSAVRNVYEQASRYQLLCGLIVYMLIATSISELLLLLPNGALYQDVKKIFIVLGISKLVEVACTACHPIVHTSTHYHWSIYYTIWLCITGLLTNVLLIPKWGVLGAAFATLITTVSGYTLLQILLYRRLGIHQFSWRMLRTVLLGVILGAVVLILPEWDNVWTSLFVKGGVMIGASLAGIYFMKLAPEAWTLIISRVCKRT